MDTKIGKPEPADGLAVFHVVRSCPELDANSLYAYLMLCSEFGQTSRVARMGDEVVGFVCGFRPPGRPEALFVWQIAVAPRARGLGLGSRMLDSLAADLSVQPEPITHLEATVSPGNAASRAMFGAFAERHAAALEELPYLEQSHFGEFGHEAEPLLRIGPLSLTKKEESNHDNY